MAVQFAPTPSSLYRIGRAPDPLSFPPLAFSGAGRYDDPQRRRSTLSAAVERRAIFLETLDPFRPDLVAFAERDGALGDMGRARHDPQVIPDQFFTRMFVRFRVAEGGQWLDVRTPETHAVLQEELGPALAQAGGSGRFVLGDLLANDHAVTRLVAGWAIDHGFDGIAYASCHNPALTCWALFEGAALTTLAPARPINRDDPDLHAVARLWNLRIPGRAVR